MRRAIAALLVLSAPGAASAQSMTPMRGIVESHSDEFALRVYPRNVYEHPITFDMRLYDESGQPVRGMIWPQTFRAAAGQARAVTVLVPFEGRSERRVRVCAESAPMKQEQNQLKARICGRYLARQLP